MKATEAQKQTNKLCGNPGVTPKAKHNQQPTKPYILSHADGGGEAEKKKAQRGSSTLNLNPKP